MACAAVIAVVTTRHLSNFKKSCCCCCCCWRSISRQFLFLAIFFVLCFESNIFTTQAGKFLLMKKNKTKSITLMFRLSLCSPSIKVLEKCSYIRTRTELLHDHWEMLKSCLRFTWISTFIGLFVSFIAGGRVRKKWGKNEKFRFRSDNKKKHCKKRHGVGRSLFNLHYANISLSE